MREQWLVRKPDRWERLTRKARALCSRPFLPLTLWDWPMTWLPAFPILSHKMPSTISRQGLVLCAEVESLLSGLVEAGSDTCSQLQLAVTSRNTPHGVPDPDDITWNLAQDLSHRRGDSPPEGGGHILLAGPRDRHIPPGDLKHRARERKTSLPECTARHAGQATVRSGLCLLWAPQTSFPPGPSEPWAGQQLPLPQEGSHGSQDHVGLFFSGLSTDFWIVMELPANQMLIEGRDVIWPTNQTHNLEEDKISCFALWWVCAEPQEQRYHLVFRI